MHSTLPARASLLPALAAAVVALFTIEHYRLFVSGLAFALGDARSVPAPIVGVVGVATMGLSFLALLILPGAGRGTGLSLTGLAVLARLGSQVVEEPLLLVLVAAFGLVLGGLAIPALAVVHGGRLDVQHPVLRPGGVRGAPPQPAGQHGLREGLPLRERPRLGFR